VDLSVGPDDDPDDGVPRSPTTWHDLAAANLLTERERNVDPGPAPSAPHLHVRIAASLTARPVRYLWRQRIARGKMTVLGGDPGVGKGTIGIDIAARLSSGTPWPDGHAGEICKTFLLTGEDDPEDTIRPRLDAAGADSALVVLIDRITDPQTGPRRLSLDTDAEHLMRHVANDGGGALIIDPVSSYLGNTNSWRDSDLRHVLDPLAEAARNHDVAVLLVIHLNKSGGQKAMYRFQGNIAHVAAARFAFLVAAHPDDPERRVLAAVKANNNRLAASLSFHIVPAFHQGIQDDVGYIQWDAGTVALTADELLSSGEDTSKAKARAERFLTDYLQEHGRSASDAVKDAARAAGIGQNSLWKAKSDLNVQAVKNGLGGWDWALPRP
ncbi:MAG: AAA family ATPase, partial [Actinomycetota bacterium]|nr:AAA family ATPase [Actinomycetota bacterium]